MFNPLLIILYTLLLNSNYESVFVQGRRAYEEVYKKDFSEHCRRRVVPSVFLGRQVVEANSQILHFSKLDLPYSCFISVKSESGSNIILVMEFLSRTSLLSSCTKDNDQLVIYEMRETFGGYWGPLADNLINEDIKNETKYYTIKTTPSLESLDSSIEYDNVYDETAVSTEQITTHNLRPQNEDYIEEEVPIVNVSGFLFSGVKPRPGIGIDSIFDTAYEASSGSGISYETTILPLIQFSASNDFNARRNKDVSKYQIDYNISSLPIDVNFIYPKSTSSKKRKLYRKYKYNSDKLLNFKTNEFFFKTSNTSFSFHKYRNRLTTISRLEHDLRREFTFTSDFITIRKSLEKTLSWDIIDTLLKGLNKTSKQKINVESSTSESTSQLFQKISEIKHNLSVYLSPNLSIYTEKSKVISSHDHYTNIPTTVNFSFYQVNPFSASEISISQITAAPTVIIQNSSQTNGSALSQNFTKRFIIDNLETKHLHTINNNVTNENNSNTRVSDSEFVNLNSAHNTEGNILLKSSFNSTVSPVFSYNTKQLRGSLVDRESWENVVQIAPMMADILSLVNSNKSENTKTNNKRRKKRHINSISVDIAKPHKKISRKKTDPTTTGTFNKVDMHEFAQLIELQDDEMQGRVALRYKPDNVGPVLFNICNNEEVLARHVYLFNSSRIILAISNFTIDKMTLILTPARTLFTSEERCLTTQFECQVSGARVCIDSLTACDGVPNCGSYDVYDEDRLMCGGATGLQHNVYLAAFTFLAVLLTLMYIVHYWLKRCVPKVSEAFFIYTEGIENMLYLDSVMRNPNEDDYNSKSLYQPNIFEVDLLCPVINEERKENRVIKAIRRILVICTCFLYKGKNNDKYEDNIYSTLSEPKRMYSFTELEIRKMLRNNLIETSVQTGDSLEMKHLNKNIESDEYDRLQGFNKTDLNSSSFNTSIILKQKNVPDELCLMKFLNVSRSSSQTLLSNSTLKIKTSNGSSTTPEEKEIQSHVYEQQNRNIPSSSTGGATLTHIDIHKEKASSSQTKHLRFEEGATMIPADLFNDNDDTDIVDKTGHRRSVVLGTGRSWNTKNLDTIEEIHEQGSSSNRDYIRFWSKSKKSKKPHS